MKRFWFLTLGLLFVLAACAPKPTPAPTPTPIPPTAVPTAIPTPASPFDYNAKVPFDTKIISQNEQDGVTVTQLSYAAHDPSWAPNFGGRTVATLVSPKGNGPFAGILYAQSGGDAPTSEYLNEAVANAKHGALSLLPTVYFLTSFTPTVTQADRPLLIGQLIELRRAFDFLLSQPGVDPQRLGFVGHNEGATYGGVLAGVDKRAKAYVLVGGWPSFANFICASWYTYCPPPHQPTIDKMLTYVKDIDPITWIPSAAPAGLFFQFWKNDPGLTENLANQFYTAASQPKQVEWYDDNSLATDPVVKARQAWLIEQLKLAP